MKLSFEITLDSDYHVGAGHGDSLVDSILLRDGDGLPVIRGSAIAGLLRDGLYRLLQLEPLKAHAGRCQASGLPEKEADGEKNHRFCGQCGQAGEACPLCRIFGSPGQPKHWRISSARPADHTLPGNFKEDVVIGGRVVQRARISPRSRRAEARKLFSQEHGESEWRFQFTISTSEQGEAIWQEAALLTAAARAVRGLGRARRRGQGECHIHLQSREEEALWLERFRSYWLEGQALNVAEVDSPDAPAAWPEIERSGRPKRVLFIVRTEEPLLLARHSEAGNEFESTAAIPGSALLGALAALAADRYDLKEERVKATFVQTFLRGRVRFSALLPASLSDGGYLIPTIPTPLDLLTCKAFPGFEDDSSHHAVKSYALSDTPPKSCAKCRQTSQDDNVPLMKLQTEFVLVGDKPGEFSPARRHEMHIAVAPQTGRVNAGDLYGYVSLEAGQYFLGELRCEDEANWQALQSLAALPQLGHEKAISLCIGRASKRGHGQVSMWLRGCENDPLDPWRGLPLEDRVPAPSEACEIVMTLLTDAILPDMWGRGQTGFDETWLTALFQSQVKIVGAFARWREVDSFYGHIGLPRFRDIALCAGSAVGLRFEGGPPAHLKDTLAALERDGLGLRREEGYGQVVFNHPIYSNRFKDLGGNYFILSPEAVPPNAPDPTVIQTEAFCKKWEAELHDVVKMCKEETFDAIARIIRHAAGDSLATLKARLGDDAYGQPEELMGHALGGPRAKEGKKAVTSTSQGRKKIIELLDRLEKIATEYAIPASQLYRLGVEMLADRVAQGAAAARAEEKNKRKKEAAQ